MHFPIVATAQRGHDTASTKVGFERKVKKPEMNLPRLRFVYVCSEFIYNLYHLLLHSSPSFLLLLPTLEPHLLTRSLDWNGNIAQKSTSIFYTLASCTKLRFLWYFIPFFTIIPYYMVVFGIFQRGSCNSARSVLYYE